MNGSPDPGCALVFILALLGLVAGLIMLFVALVIPELKGAAYWIVVAALMAGALVFAVYWNIRHGDRR